MDLLLRRKGNAILTEAQIHHATGVRDGFGSGWGKGCKDWYEQCVTPLLFDDYMGLYYTIYIYNIEDYRNDSVVHL